MFWVKCGQECVDGYTLKIILYKKKIYYLFILLYHFIIIFKKLVESIYNQTCKC